jgi:hypothetical protein
VDTESTNATEPNQINSPMQNNDSAATSGTSLNSDPPAVPLPLNEAPG